MRRTALLLTAILAAGLSFGPAHSSWAAAESGTAKSASDAAPKTGAMIIPTSGEPAGSEAGASYGMDVSREFGANEADGVTVKRLTARPGGCMLSYYDIEAQAPDGTIYYNAPLADDSWAIMKMGPDGHGGALVMRRRPATASTKRFDMSSDGRLVTYTKVNPGGASWDLYGFSCDRGEVEEIRITDERYELGATPKVKTAPAVRRERGGGYAVAYSVGNRLFVTIARPDFGGATEKPSEIELGDAENEATFHRLRLSPKYSNILMYRRKAVSKAKNGQDDGDGFAHNNIYVIDWTEKDPRSVLWFRNDRGGPHPAWSADGEKIGLQRDGAWTEYRVAKNGRIAGGLSPEMVRHRVIGPFSRTNAAYPAVFYATYSKDGKKIAVATRSEMDGGGKIYIMDAATGKVKYLCRALFHGPETDGQPRLRFVNGGGNIVFSTDKSYGMDEVAPSQIYMIEGL